MIVLHAGNEHGFVPGGKLEFKAGSSDGDYHSEMNHQKIRRWLTEKLIPNVLGPCSNLTVATCAHCI